MVAREPGSALANLWPSHPQVELWRTMSEIGARAGRGQSLTPHILQSVDRIAAKAPLAPEPYLVRGALAQLEKRDGAAERLFVAAAWRDPRAVAAHYFLADRYLKTRRVEQALTEMAVLSRLVPATAQSFAPAVASFVASPSARPAVRRFLRTSPEFEPGVLFELARNPANADLVLQLWSGGRAPPSPNWQGQIVQSLVKAGQFDKAKAVWRRVSGLKTSSALLFNPEFRALPAPEPFNWAFNATGGVVEPAEGDRLRVIYYGREDAVLAEQLLMLAPGRYRLSLEYSGGSRGEGSVAWAVRCRPSDRMIGQIPLSADRAGKPVELAFDVPEGCRVQSLRLVGAPAEFSSSVEVMVGKLRLTKAGGA